MKIENIGLDGFECDGVFEPRNIPLKKLEEVIFKIIKEKGPISFTELKDPRLISNYYPILPGQEEFIEGAVKNCIQRLRIKGKIESKGHNLWVLA